MRKEKKSKLQESSWQPWLGSWALVDIPGWRPRWPRWARPADKEMLQMWAPQVLRAKGWGAGEVPPTMAMLAASSYSFVMTLTKAEASNKRMRGFLNWKKIKPNCGIKLNMEFLKLRWPWISSERIRHEVWLQGPSFLVTEQVQHLRLGWSCILHPYKGQTAAGDRRTRQRLTPRDTSFPSACTSKSHRFRHTGQGWL